MMQEWFRQAKFGIFVHWGIYAVDGVLESWSFYHGQVSREDYYRQAERFTADKFDADAWADLFRQAGAKYTVITSKHHDGMALFDTRLSDMSVVKKTPAKRDLLREYVDAVKRAGLRNGIYFSHCDWSDPDNAAEFKHDDTLHPCYRKKYSIPEDGIERPDDWQRYLRFHRGQIRELLENYGPVDLLWFDGEWEKTAEQWDMKGLRSFIESISPATVLNSRMYGYGDYETPEQGLPLAPLDKPWEFCETINDSWGYRPEDRNYKSVQQLLHTFIDCISMGGNYLLDVGPRADGTIDEEASSRLLEMGSWIRGNEEAIYPTVRGIPATHFAGGSTLSKDGLALYLFLFDIPQQRFCVKGIKNKIKRITLLKKNRELSFRKVGGSLWCDIPGFLWIDLDAADVERYATVVKIEFYTPLRLFWGNEPVTMLNEPLEEY